MNLKKHRIRSYNECEGNVTYITAISIEVGYRGQIRLKAHTVDTAYIIDKDKVEKFLVDSINEKGFTLSKEPRQKITRLIINE